MSRAKAGNRKAEQLAVPHPDQAKKSDFENVGGSKVDQWNQSLMNFVIRALPTSSETFSKDSQEAEKIAAILGMADCKPADPIEAMLIGQMISANATALDLQRRAWLKDQSFECRTRYLALADKSARTMATLVETLNRHRGKGQQIVRVERVTVNEGGQAIVGTVAHRGGGNAVENEKQPHGSALAHAPHAAMLGHVETQREAVPVASSRGG